MKRMTLTQFLVARQRDKSLIDADLRLLLETIARACKGISTRVNKGALADGLGSAARKCLAMAAASRNSIGSARR